MSGALLVVALWLAPSQATASGVSMCYSYTTPATAELLPAAALVAAVRARAEALRLRPCDDATSSGAPPSFRLALQLVAPQRLLVTVEGAGLFESREVAVDGTRLSEERAQRVALVVVDQVRPALAALLDRLPEPAGPSAPPPAAATAPPPAALTDTRSEPAPPALAPPSSAWSAAASAGVTVHPSLQKLEPRLALELQRGCGPVRCTLTTAAERLPSAESRGVRLDGSRFTLGAGVGQRLARLRMSELLFVTALHPSFTSALPLAFEERWLFSMGLGGSLALALARGDGWALEASLAAAYWPRPHVFTIAGSPALELERVEVSVGLGGRLGE